MGGKTIQTLAIFFNVISIPYLTAVKFPQWAEKIDDREVGY